MLSARLDGETILLPEAKWEGQEEYLRKAAREGRVLAPCCGAPLVLRWGERKTRHFAHPPRVSCPYDRWSEPESAEHMAGKLRLYNWCREHFAGRLRLLAVEHPLPETLQRPDVYLELLDGARYAFEYQRSVVSPGEWRERHEAYASLGIHDVWMLGENRLADALPTTDQQVRWSAREPHMHFLKLRAFEGEAAVRSPYEVAWWRGEQQEELWAPQELDAHVGREVSPWYNRSALRRLRSVTFLDANTGELLIYRAMRELPGHTDTYMASAVLPAQLDATLLLGPAGFFTSADRDRLERHDKRAARLESLRNQSLAVHERPSAYVVSPLQDRPLPPHMPTSLRELASSRAAAVWPADVEPRLFLPGEQEEDQRRRLQTRAENPVWRKMVGRYGLTPENLHFLVGIPLPDDTVLLAHRTVWQAYIVYTLLVYWRGSFEAAHVAALLGRKFGLDAEMDRVARYRLPGRVNGPVEVVGRFLNLLVDVGYLRNDHRSEHFRYHLLDSLPPFLAFADRRQRWAAWDELLKGSLRREGMVLVGEGEPIQLVPVEVEAR